jgi:hypothetical protein
MITKDNFRIEGVTKAVLINKSIESIKAEIELLGKLGVKLFDSENEDWAVSDLVFNEEKDEFFLKFEEVAKEVERETISCWTNKGA